MLFGNYCLIKPPFRCWGSDRGSPCQGHPVRLPGHRRQAHQDGQHGELLQSGGQGTATSPSELRKQEGPTSARPAGAGTRRDRGDGGHISKTGSASQVCGQGPVSVSLCGRGSCVGPSPSASAFCVVCGDVRGARGTGTAWHLASAHSSR